MRHNFILKKDNVHIFKQRFEKMLNKTSLLQINGYYIGARKIAHLTEHFEDELSLAKPVLQTITSFFLKGKTSFDTYGKDEGLIIRMHKDACMVLFYGQKLRITSNRIYIIGDKDKWFTKYSKNNYKKLTIIQSSFDIKKASERIKREEFTADAYYESLDDDYGSDFEDTIDENDMLSQDEMKEWMEENKNR